MEVLFIAMAIIIGLDFLIHIGILLCELFGAIMRQLTGE